MFRTGMTSKFGGRCQKMPMVNGPLRTITLRIIFQTGIITQKTTGPPIARRPMSVGKIRKARLPATSTGARRARITEILLAIRMTGAGVSKIRATMPIGDTRATLEARRVIKVGKARTAAIGEVRVARRTKRTMATVKIISVALGEIKAIMAMLIGQSMQAARKQTPGKTTTVKMQTLAGTATRMGVVDRIRITTRGDTKITMIRASKRVTAGGMRTVAAGDSRATIGTSGAMTIIEATVTVEVANTGLATETTAMVVTIMDMTTNGPSTGLRTPALYLLTGTRNAVEGVRMASGIATTAMIAAVITTASPRMRIATVTTATIIRRGIAIATTAAVETQTTAVTAIMAE